MFRNFIILAIIFMTIGFAQARSNPLEREAESYIRHLLRAHPELAEGKKTREARKDLYKKMKRGHILKLTKEEEKKLRRHKELILDSEFQSLLKLINAVKDKDPDVEFLAKYASGKKIKFVKKLLAYRLIKKIKHQLEKSILVERRKTLSEAVAVYKKRKKSNGNKSPATLEDLQLPEDCRQFTHPITRDKKDWIYLHHPKIHLKVGKSYAVLIEPKSINNVRFCGLANGKVKKVKEAWITKALGQNRAKIEKEGVSSQKKKNSEKKTIKKGLKNK